MDFWCSNSMSTSKSDRTVQSGVPRGFGAGTRRPSRSRVRYELWRRTAIKPRSHSSYGNTCRRVSRFGSKSLPYAGYQFGLNHSDATDITGSQTWLFTGYPFSNASPCQATHLQVDALVTVTVVVIRNYVACLLLELHSPECLITIR